MNVIFLMALLALLFSGGFVICYIWATSKGQFDDLKTPALRMLKDDSQNNKNLKGIHNED